MKSLKPYLRSEKGEGEILVLLFISALAVLGPAFLVRVLFDRAVPERNVPLIAAVALAVPAFEVLGISSRLKSGRLLAVFSRLSQRRQRFRFTETLTSLNLGWFEASGPGALLRHHEDAGVLGGLRMSFVEHVLGPLMVVLVTLPPMIFINPLLTLCRLVLLLPALAAGVFFLNRDLILEQQIWEVRQLLATRLFRCAQGMASLKESASAGNYARYLRFYQDRLGGLEEKRRLLNSQWEAAGAGLGRLGGTLTPVVAVWLVISGSLSFGGYIAFSIIAGRCISASRVFFWEGRFREETD